MISSLEFSAPHYANGLEALAGKPFTFAYHVYERRDAGGAFETDHVVHDLRAAARGEVHRRQEATLAGASTSYAVVEIKSRVVDFYYPRQTIVMTEAERSEILRHPVEVHVSTKPMSPEVEISTPKLEDKMAAARDASTTLGSGVSYKMETVLLQGREWRVTPFHCVVGEITRAHFGKIALAWSDAYGDAIEPGSGFGASFVDPRDPFSRLGGAREVVSLWRKTYANAWLLFYTDDHRVLDELLPGEASLATSSGGDVSAINFLDLPETPFKSPADLKVGAGDYWLARVEESRRRRMVANFAGVNP